MKNEKKTETTDKPRPVISTDPLLLVESLVRFDEIIAELIKMPHDGAPEFFSAAITRLKEIEDDLIDNIEHGVDRGHIQLHKVIRALVQQIRILKAEKEKK